MTMDKSTLKPDHTGLLGRVKARVEADDPKIDVSVISYDDITRLALMLNDGQTKRRSARSRKRAS